MPLLISMLVMVMKWFGGAALVENTIENYLASAPWMPAWGKKLIVPAVTFVGAVTASIYGGMDPMAALATAAGFSGTVALLHNHPATTSADTSIPASAIPPASVVNPGK